MFKLLTNLFNPYSKENVEQQKFVADTFNSSELGKFITQLHTSSDSKDPSFALSSFTASRHNNYLYILYHTETADFSPKNEIARIYLERDSLGTFTWNKSSMLTSIRENNNAVIFSWQRCSQEQATSDFISKVINHPVPEVRQAGSETIQFFQTQGLCVLKPV